MSLPRIRIGSQMAAMSKDEASFMVVQQDLARHGRILDRLIKNKADEEHIKEEQAYIKNTERVLLHLQKELSD